MTENLLANSTERGNKSNVHKPRIQCPKPATNEALRGIRERTPILTAIFINSGLFLIIALSLAFTFMPIQNKMKGPAIHISNQPRITIPKRKPITIISKIKAMSMADLLFPKTSPLLMRVIAAMKIMGIIQIHIKFEYTIRGKILIPNIKFKPRQKPILREPTTK